MLKETFDKDLRDLASEYKRISKTKNLNAPLPQEFRVKVANLLNRGCRPAWIAQAIDKPHSLLSNWLRSLQNDGLLRDRNGPPIDRDGYDIPKPVPTTQTSSHVATDGWITVRIGGVELEVKVGDLDKLIKR